MSSGREPALPVAIIGIGCRYPGAVDGPDAFWRFLMEGHDAIGEIPADRIDLAHYFDPRPATPGRIMTRWGGFLDGIELFDAGFFGISPREAERLDPQQRLVLETAWEALEDAGQRVPSLAGSRTGVFLGQWLSDFEARLFADPERADFLMTTGSGRYATSGRISYLLGLEGPSLTLDTACSSSLVAVHLAARSIRDGESELALAGGVNVILQPHISVAYSQSRMMAPDGHCKFGDASGDGYVRSEGAGIVVLKALDRALADGDRVYAVIRGGAINNDGRCSGSMGTPARAGQVALLRTAYADAGISPGAVGYIEAHGTGTRAGDPVELGALGDVLGEGRGQGQRARVGSVKTNFGHTEGAAGVAGLIKLALCLHHRAIPASLNCRELNPAVPWDTLPLEIARTSGSWEGEALVGGVSAFGIAGTNAHIVLQSAPPVAVTTSTQGKRGLQLLPLSARSPEALRELATRYGALLKSQDEDFLPDLCGEAANRRGALECRAAFIETNAAAMRAALAQYVSGEPAAAADTAPAERPRVAFIVPGQGAQWIGMSRELLATEPVFRDAIVRCDAAARRYVDWSIVGQIALDKAAPGYLMDRIDVIQPVLVAMAIGYADWLAAQGIRPDAVVGHSMGEVGSAYIAGVLDLDSAMRIICRRSALMREQSGRGAMALVDLSIADAEARIGDRGDRVAVAVSNSPRSSVISGDPVVVDAILAECERDGVFCRRVNVDVASHSPQMDDAAARLGEELRDLAVGIDGVALYSTVLARRAAGSEFGGSYWAQNLRRPVRFADAVTAMLGDGISVFIELGPHPVLLPAIQQTAQAAGSPAVVTIGCGRRNEPEQRNLLATAAAAWAAGVEVDWQALQPRTGTVDLPRYPWQRERYWVREARQRGPVGVSSPIEELDTSLAAWLQQLQWVPTESQEAGEDGFKAAAWLVAARESPLAQELVSALEAQGRTAKLIAPADVATALRERGEAGQRCAVVLVPDSGNGAAWSLVSFVQSCVAARSRMPMQLWAVTCGAQAGEGLPSRTVDVMQGALWGAGRVIAEELPEIWGGLIDADPARQAGESAVEVVRELISSSTAGQRALRDGKSFQLRLRPLQSAEIDLGSAPWRADGAYLITGGLGAIGLQIASAMVARGARRLVLLGRHGLPARHSWSALPTETREGRRVAAVRQLESDGASVHVLEADAADFDALKRSLDEYERAAWPPIVGVIHAAGTTENRLVEHVQREEFDRVLDAKLSSAQHLDRLFPDVRQFILLSSIGAALGWPGIANYAAANAGLDALAHQRRARGSSVQCIQWGPWKSTGMHAGEEIEKYFAELQRQGIGEFTAEQGVQLFCGLAATTLHAATVVPIDWALLQSNLRGRRRELFTDRLQPLSGGVRGESDLASSLATATSVEQRRTIVEGLVRDAVSKVLGMAPQRLDIRKPLGSMGLNSLMAMEVRNRLEAALGRTLSASLTWNYPTIEQMVKFLNGETGSAATSTAVHADPASPAEMSALGEVMDHIAELSDEDAARELLGLGGSRQ